ncbi:hypothetical protein [Allomuricauda sp. d1]|uniref:hypothetical protein n=1 Tax=Allomuricauda sp. d1 TaxID=3136725 RepID=UPI0031D190C2
MKSPKKKTLFTIAVAISFILIVGILIAGHIFKTKTEEALSSKIPAAWHLNYESLETNVLLGKISLDNIKLSKSNPDKKQGLEIQARSIILKGLDYSDMLLKKQLKADQLTIQHPKAYLNNDFQSNGAKSDTLSTGENKFEIGEVIIENGSLTVFDQKSDSVLHSVGAFDIKVSELTNFSDKSSLKKPVNYSLEKLLAKNIEARLGRFEILKLDDIHLESSTAELRNVELKTKNDKKTLSSVLNKERDHVQLTIPKVELEGLHQNFWAEPASLKISKLTFSNPKAQVYRDKLLPDDTRHKKMFGHMLRHISWKLAIDSVHIKDGRLSYKEKVKEGFQPDSLLFTAIDMNITNVQNIEDKKASVNSTAKLMGKGAFELDWSFYPLDVSDRFTASGQLMDFNSENINPFLRTNLEAKVKGEVNEFYFTVSGNAIKSSGDMKMKYEDFEFMVLKKDLLGINKVFTAVVNIFANDGSKTDAQGYRYGQIEVERDPTKSFFNYLWRNVKDGLVDTVTGDGEKE